MIFLLIIILIILSDKSVNIMTKRCDWVLGMIHEKHHDTEWGVPLHNDQKLFEFLILDGFQSGLSWKIILNKRESFRKAFDGFDPEKIINYNYKKLTI